MTKAGEIDEDFQPILTLELADFDVKFPAVIDTGSYLPLMSGDWSLLHLMKQVYGISVKREGMGFGYVYLADGITKWKYCLVRVSFKIDNVKFQTSIAVPDKLDGYTTSPPLDSTMPLLGSPLLRFFRAVLDYPNRSVELRSKFPDPVEIKVGLEQFS